jgi:uncharacterized hydrophobic protein (TIGR00271 family)
MNPIAIIRRILHYLNLERELDDYATIHSVIEKDLVFKGTNLWILIFAIVLASVGLNMNSTAVIIGAMLISPLMGPINGMGYSLATYNFPLLRKAIKNYSFAVLAGLFTSTAYFALSPVSTAHSELLARTSPTIYDVIIALFGGLAGIVAITSKQKGNVIPGVAIATALMPPLCTAGYGLATAQFNFFFGAFYLFTINTVFIALAAVLFSQILRFPITTVVDPLRKKRVNQWISIIITITLIPSIYFGYSLVQNERFAENVKAYTNQINIFRGSYLLRHEVSPSSKSINLVYGGNQLTEEDKAELKRIAAGFSLANAEINITQGFSLEGPAEEIKESDNLRSEVNRLKTAMNESERRQEMEKQLGKDLLQEIRSLYPQLTACTYSEAYHFSSESGKTAGMYLIVFETHEKVKEDDREKIRVWLRKRLKTEEVRVIFEEKGGG